MLLDRGDTLLIESPTYSGTLAALRPMGVNFVPIETDHNGLIPKSLSSVLNNWPKDKRKPKVLYTVPIGGKTINI
jgi:DNA-binding transcriptional MocR family regulator